MVTCRGSVANFRNTTVDGDSLYLSSVKEMATVIDMLKIHPMATLLGGEGDALSGAVKCSDEMSIAMHQYFTDCGNLDIESYRKQITDAA